MKILSLTLSLVFLLTVMAVSLDSDRKYIVLQRDAAKTAPFSEAVLVGNTLYIAGHLGIDPKTGKPGATPEEEARLVMESLKRTVEAAGLSMADIVSVQVFCSDVSVFAHGSSPSRETISAACWRVSRSVSRAHGACRIEAAIPTRCWRARASPSNRSMFCWKVKCGSAETTAIRRFSWGSPSRECSWVKYRCCSTVPIWRRCAR